MKNLYASLSELFFRYPRWQEADLMTRRRALLMLAIIVMAQLSMVLLSLFNWQTGNREIVLLCAVTMIFLAWAHRYILVRRDMEFIGRIGIAAMFAALIAQSLLPSVGGGAALIWSALFPPAAYFFRGFESGARWNTGFLAAAGALTALAYAGVALPYRPDAYLLQFLGLLFISTFVYFYEAVRFEYETRLQRHAAELEKRVEAESAKRIAQEKALYEQARIASIGEMIASLAHHWRQPLSVISLIVQDLIDAHEHGEIDRAYLEQNVAEALRHIDRMSATIDTFRRFYRPAGSLEPFFPAQAVEEVQSILAAQMRNEGIRFENLIDPGLSYTGRRSDFKQVLLQLLQNACEAIGRAQPALKWIAVSAHTGGGMLEITVSDSGGGIKNQPIERLFEPYAGTKGLNNTGLGLYLAKGLIEGGMNGKILLKNSPEGLDVTLQLPL
ncbi:MAG: sensor histidine kinase [Campylobacterales bacterium]